MKSCPRFFLLVALIIQTPAASALGGRVVDAVSGRSLAGSIITRGEEVITADHEGRYTLAGSEGTVAARAIGYRRGTLMLVKDTRQVPDLRLTPFRPKALYLSFWGIGDRKLRQAALDKIKGTELNALVIDVKGDRGWIPYPTRVALAGAIGARRVTTVHDMPALIAKLKIQGIYLIARIVVFKDDPFATAHPELAVRTAGGALFRDREGLAWTDPSRPEVWTYNLDIAAEAAQLGFDEIQFDYLRFPDAAGLAFAAPNTEAQRVRAISGFLAAARKRLAPYNVFIAVDIFGYVLWNLNDTFIGQKLEELATQVDYLSPMLYPSGFRFGIPGYTNPVAHPHEIVWLSLRRAADRTGMPPLRFRPWLQAFRDYAFDRRAFTAEAIRLQVDAAQMFGSNGWMLWNPRNNYSSHGLNKE